jgi:RNA polymerase sigma factor (sigma-70 family)
MDNQGMDNSRTSVSGSGGAEKAASPAVPRTSTTMLKQIAGAADHPRWAEFVAKYRPMLSSYLQCNFPELEADELIQETLLGVMRALPDYVADGNEKGAFHNFLTGVLRHKALGVMRREERRKRLEKSHAEETAKAGTAPDAAEEAAWRETVYAAALSQLLSDPSVNARHKQMFVRTALMGEKPAAVAESLLATRDAVDQAKKRLTARLREIVERLERVDG